MAGCDYSNIIDSDTSPSSEEHHGTPAQCLQRISGISMKIDAKEAFCSLAYSTGLGRRNVPKHLSLFSNYFILGSRIILLVYFR